MVSSFALGRFSSVGAASTAAKGLIKVHGFTELFACGG